MNSFFRKLRWLTQRSEKEAELREELQFHLEEEAEQRQEDGSDGGRGPMGGTPRTGQRRSGEGGHSRRVGLDATGAIRARCRLRTAPDPPQSGVLGHRHRDTGARHRREHRDVQRRRRGADSSAAVRRRGPSRHDLGRHEPASGRRSTLPTPAEWLEWRRHNTVFTDIAATQPGEATLSGDRRARTGAGAQGHRRISGACLACGR